MSPTRAPGSLPAARSSALAVLVVFFQIGVVSEVPVFGVNVDLSPLLVAFVGLLCGSTVGAVDGFAVGLLVDLALLQTLGVTSLIFTLDRLLVAGACASCATRRRRSRRCSSGRGRRRRLAGRLLADGVHARRRRARQPRAAAPDRAGRGRRHDRRAADVGDRARAWLRARCPRTRAPPAPRRAYTTGGLSPLSRS